jgi:hypothetical protein
MKGKDIVWSLYVWALVFVELFVHGYFLFPERAWELFSSAKGGSVCTYLISGTQFRRRPAQF